MKYRGVIFPDIRTVSLSKDPTHGKKKMPAQMRWKKFFFVFFFLYTLHPANSFFFVF